jgi:sulfur-carrier protein adenylyltransferase/sulfurtransferase
MLEASNTMEMYFSPVDMADILIKKAPSIQLIDVRTPDQFEKFSLPNTINIPLTELLAEKNRDILNHSVYYSNGTTDAVKAWMISKQL